VFVTEVDPNGLASEHGFKTGDVILDVGGKTVATPADVRNAVSDAYKNGAAAWRVEPSSDRLLTKPTTGSFSGCCALSVSGHATAAPPSVAKNSRRPMWLAM
jgi:membrane-associated protease RseP (regulator of RpoE activity)